MKIKKSIFRKNNKFRYQMVVDDFFYSYSVFCVFWLSAISDRERPQFIVGFKRIITIFSKYKYITICIFISCSTKTKNDNSTLSKNLNLDKSQVGELNDSSKRNIEYFDNISFKADADSLVSNITAEKINLELRIDTIKYNSNEFNYFRYLKTKDNLYIVYNFFPGKKRSMLRFRISQIIFNDTLTLNKAFSLLKDDANGVNFNKRGEERDISPGLTYTNDYVIKTENQILWLNLPCSYNDQDSKRIRKIFKNSLTIGEIKDSINCKCGDSWCKP